MGHLKSFFSIAAAFTGIALMCSCATQGRASAPNTSSHEFLKQARVCEEAASDQNLNGSVKALWVVNSEGKVTKAAVKETAVDGSDFTQFKACLVSVLTSLRYPVSAAGQSFAEEFSFKPSEVISVTADPPP